MMSNYNNKIVLKDLNFILKNTQNEKPLKSIWQHATCLLNIKTTLKIKICNVNEFNIVI